MNCKRGTNHENLSVSDLELMHLISNKNVEGVDNKLKNYQLNINVNCGSCYSNHTPLTEAVGTGNEQIIGLILNHPDININQSDGNQWAPVHIAAHLKLPNIVRLLIMHGAREFVTIDNGKTPLHEAVYNNDCDSIHALLTQLHKKSIRTCTSGVFFTLLCCFNRFKSDETCKIDLPKDLQKVLCAYAFIACVEDVIEEKLKALKPLLQHEEERSKKTALNIVQETWQAPEQWMLSCLDVANVARLRQLIVQHALFEYKFINDHVLYVHTSFNSTSKHRSSEK